MISLADSFELCFRFLDELYWRLNQDFDDDLPVLLGSMELPFDRAAQMQDWQEACPDNATPSQIYQAVGVFLNNYRQRGEGSNQEITFLIELLASPSQEVTNIWKSIVSSR